MKKARDERRHAAAATVAATVAATSSARHALLWKVFAPAVNANSSKVPTFEGPNVHLHHLLLCRSDVGSIAHADPHTSLSLFEVKNTSNIPSLGIGTFLRTCCLQTSETDNTKYSTSNIFAQRTRRSKETRASLH